MILECVKLYGDMEIVTKTHDIIIKAMGIVTNTLKLWQKTEILVI